MPGRALSFYFSHRGALLLLLAWPIAAWALDGSPVRPVEIIVGLVLLAGGVALRLLAIRRIGHRARVYRASARDLIRSGPYAWSRNPLYLAAACMLAGVATLAGAGAGAVLESAAALALYTPVVICEERILRHHFGEVYADYARDVPRWLAVRRAARTRSATPDPLVAWDEVLRRENALVPGCIAAAAGTVSVRLGLIPIAAVLEPVARELGTSPAGVVGAGLAIAALLDAWRIDRRLRRRRARTVAAAAPTASRV